MEIGLIATPLQPHKSITKRKTLVYMLCTPSSIIEPILYLRQQGMLLSIHSTFQTNGNAGNLLTTSGCNHFCPLVVQSQTNTRCRTRGN
ncbi:hypothetical protein CEXT_415071 [Caerostris extrusa]|uniref:Uncharacterized protein n=1 Tax=Caerostris extrusa TaxID=172846 RepID=A0AAV4NTG6_CAEEX|nr:hypothetical protein CEXT_415071 [Caerostris extrusa]